MRDALLPMACLLLAALAPATGLASECSYHTYEWNTLSKRADNYRRVEKPYAELTPEEIDEATGCTVCEQDQRWLRVGDAQPVRVCKHFAADFEAVLGAAIDDGYRVEKLVGYRVGRTRGEPDADGRRTGFSNHSYGIALDINSHRNGLYTSCLSFGDACRLIRGGRWMPGVDPLSIAADSLLVQRMRAAGFAWGGEIRGRQKDFMHFSPSGY